MPYKNQQKSFFTDTFYHVYARGENKKNIFIDKSDYKFFLYLLKKYLTPGFTEKKLIQGETINMPVNSVSEDVDLLSYCLIPNHFHLIIFNKSELGMSSLFRRVMSVYSNYFNIEHNCQGSLIEGNYRAIPITSTYYLINAFLYVHLNPVKHKLVKDAKDYPYSSLKFYLDPKRSPRWVKINKEILSEVDFTRINFYIKDTENWEGLI